MKHLRRTLSLLLATIASIVPIPDASAAGEKPVSLAIYNYTGQPVQIFWINSAGVEKSYGTAHPIAAGGAPKVQPTFSGHQWIFRSGRQNQPYIAGTGAVQPLVFGNPSPDQNVSKPKVTPPKPKTIPPVVSTGSGSKAVQEFMKVHNDARAKVGVPPLRWSATLADYAQQWADQLAATGQFRHRPQTGAGYGESIFGGSPGFTPGDAARSWLSERSAYRGGPVTAQNNATTGHYTQMVWRDTTEVGYGIATGPNGVIVVGNYSPGGNFLGLKPY